jgi:uncharacterized protein
MSKEKRYSALQFRREEGTRKIDGCAIVFNSLSEDLGGFRELVKPEAVTQVLLDGADIKFYYNHNDRNIPLARYRGKNVIVGHKENTLNVEVRTDGVWFWFDAPSTAAGDELLDAVDRGVIDRCSFCFSAERTGYTIEKREGENVRVISAFTGLYDFSAVDDPAYEATDVMTRDIKSALEELGKDDKEVRLAATKGDLEKRGFTVEQSEEGEYGYQYKGLLVEEIKNGWLTTSYEYGYDDEGHWYDKEEKEYSPTNPTAEQVSNFFLDVASRRGV